MPVGARNTIMRPSPSSPVVVERGMWPWMAGDGLCGEERLDERDVGGDVAGIWAVPSG
jgi:hypothetical protein